MILYRLFLSLLILLSFVGCKNAEDDIEGNSPVGLDLETYIESVELPKHFSIAFDPTEVKSVDRASEHTASILDFDEQNRIMVTKELVQGEIIDTKNYAEGQWLEADLNDVKEYLTIYDGGKSLGMDSGVNGGLQYTNLINNMGWGNETVVSTASGPPHLTDQLVGYGLKSDYESFVDLDFMSHTDALAKVEYTLDKIDFPELVVSEAYSLDLDTIKDHYNLYLEANNHEEYDWSKTDESYLFIFQQIIDDIPLIDVYWQKSPGIPDQQTGSSHVIDYTSGYAIYSEDGITNLAASNLLDIAEEGEEHLLIDGANALKLVIDSYSEVLLATEISVTSMQLYYVAILTGENSYKLIPAWIFEITEENEWSDALDDTITPYHDYSYFVVNAITGDQIEEASDLE